MNKVIRVIILAEDLQHLSVCKGILQKAGVDPIVIQSGINFSEFPNILQEGESNSPQETVQLSPDTCLDFHRQVVRRKDLTFSLSGTELRILRALYSRLGRTYPTMDLIDEVWGYSSVGLDSLYVYIRRIREKIEDNPRQPKLLITHHRYGYELKSQRIQKDNS